MNLSLLNGSNKYNNPSFGAYFNNKNAIHLKRLCNDEFNESSANKLNEELDWFTKELPNQELEITQFENLPGLSVSSTAIPIRGRQGHFRYQDSVVQIKRHQSRYTITNKDTGNSANVFADNIFQFFDGIKKQSGILFDETKNSLTEGLNEFGAEVITKLTTKQ